jgi:transcription initiation factor TFIID subunit 2
MVYGRRQPSPFQRFAICFRLRQDMLTHKPQCATAELNWVGQFHLMKAFQEFFCFSGSPIPRSNDFTDFTAYYVQKAIPTAMSRIRNVSGACPTSAQRWLLDVLRYNDNSNNNVSASCFEWVHFCLGLIEISCSSMTATMLQL